MRSGDSGLQVRVLPGSPKYPTNKRLFAQFCPSRHFIKYSGSVLGRFSSLCLDVQRCVEVFPKGQVSPKTKFTFTPSACASMCAEGIVVWRKQTCRNQMFQKVFQGALNAEAAQWVVDLFRLIQSGRSSEATVKIIRLAATPAGRALVAAINRAAGCCNSSLWRPWHWVGSCRHFHEHPIDDP
jgi:hypothetical protein